MEEFKKVNKCIFPREPYDLSKERTSTTFCKVATPDVQFIPPRELYELLIESGVAEEENLVPIGKGSILLQRNEALAIGAVSRACGEFAIEYEIGAFLSDVPYYVREDSKIESNIQYFGRIDARVKK